jgi:VanZ family protein
MSEREIPEKVVYAAALIYLVVLTVLAVFPFTATGMQNVNSVYFINFRLDHILHIITFVPIFPLAWWFVRPQGKMAYLVLLVICLETAILAELVQYYIHYRSFNPTDMIANAIGTAIGFFAVILLNRYYIITRRFGN